MYKLLVAAANKASALMDAPSTALYTAIIAQEGQQRRPRRAIMARYPQKIHAGR